MTLSVATWNINSVRLRIGLVADFLKAHRPDVLCLQEIKCINDNFPYKAFRRRGYTHIAVNGQKGYHGVAIVSKRPFLSKDIRMFCGKVDSRHVSVAFGESAGLAAPLVLHNFYVPAGGDVPDPEVNEKFAHKLQFLEDLATWWDEQRTPSARRILVGDLNVAPLETDVWSHRQLLNVVSHTPAEVERLGAVQAAHDWVDAVRHFIPPERKLFSWWSYRARDWAASDRGRRLDHIWVTPALVPALRDAEILREARGWPQPSDHVPVLVDLEV